MGQVVALRTGYEPVEQREDRLVSRAQLAREFGVCPKTVDRWVSRDGMPQDTPKRQGCWVMIGCQRRYYAGRVHDWVSRRAFGPV